MLRLSDKQRDIICKEMGWNDEPEMQEDLRDWKQFNWVLTIPGATPGLENDDIYVDEEFPYLVGYIYYDQFYGICNVGCDMLACINSEPGTGIVSQLTPGQMLSLFRALKWDEAAILEETKGCPWVIGVPGESGFGYNDMTVTDDYPYSVGILRDGEYIEYDSISLALWRNVLSPNTPLPTDRPLSNTQAFTWLMNKGGKR